MKKTVGSLLSIGLLLAAWQLLAVISGKPELVPTVGRLLESMMELLMSGSFLRSVGATVGRGLAGMLLSLCAAAGVAVMMSRMEWVYELFRPLLVLMRSVPVISFILLALIFLQPENIPLLIAFLTMFPLLSENLIKGLKSLRPGLMTLGKTFRMRRVNRYTQVLYPQIKPFLFSGLASAAGFGWRAVIMGEVLSQCAWGIGSEMKRAQTFIDVPLLLGWTLVAVVLSFTFDKGLSWLGQRCFSIRYRPSGTTLPPPTCSPVLLDNVSKAYGKTPVLQGLSLAFEAGKIYGISAPSGAGKTTLLRLIDGSLLPSSGSLTVDRQRGIACVFQEPELIPSLTVLENAALPLASLFSRYEAQERASRFLALMEMEPYAGRLPEQLSYGQQQRASLARALAFPAPVVLLDEPFKGMDEELTVRIIHRMREQYANSMQTVIFVTHKPEELMLLADIKLKLY